MKDRNGKGLQVGSEYRVVDNANTAVQVGDIGKYLRNEEWEEGTVAILQFNDALMFEQGLFENQIEIIWSVRDE